MKLLLVVLLSVGATASNGWTSEGKRENYAFRNDYSNFHHHLMPFPESVGYDFEFPAKPNGSQPEQGGEESKAYTHRRGYLELRAAEINLWCYLVGVCHYNYYHYTALASKWVAFGKTRDVSKFDHYLSMMELFENAYGTRFSHPIDGQDEKYEEREVLLKRLRAALFYVLKQWEQIETVKTVKYYHELKVTIEAVAFVVDNEMLKNIMERAEIVYYRANAHPVASDFVHDTFSDQAIYHTPINVTREVEEIQGFVSRLFGYIFDVNPSFNNVFVIFGKESQLQGKDAAAVASFRRALQDLYGDLVSGNRVKIEGSFELAQREMIFKKVYDTAHAIWQFWWDQIHMLGGKLEPNRKIEAQNQFDILIWAKVMYASSDDIESLEERLEEIKVLTFADTFETTIEVDSN